MLKKTIIGVGAAVTLTLGAGTTIAVDDRIDPYTDRGTYFELPIENELGQRDMVKIAKDRAEVTLEKWGGEDAITIRRAGQFNRSSRAFLSKTRRMESRDGKEAVFIEPVRQQLTETDDGVKIDILLNEKPTTNVFTFDIEGADNFDFFYQPPLNEEPLDPSSVSCTETQCFGADGNITTERPENVVGSLAVYHKTKRNYCTNCGTPNYATGKAYHIYRPKVFDSDGNEIWAELSYVAGTLSVTVPQGFLDTATYPVRVDPTFGYETIGGSTHSSGSDWIVGSLYTIPEDGTIESISTYIKSGTRDDGPITFAIYDWGGSSGSLVANTGTDSSPASDDWNTLTITAGSTSLTASTDYMLVHWGEEFSIGYDVLGANIALIDSENYPGSWPSTIVDLALNDKNYSIYATYTASGGAPAPIKKQSVIFFSEGDE